MWSQVVDDWKTPVEYIEREAAIKAMEKADCAVISDDADSCKADYLREIIESVPAADVVPVEHGKWIESANFDTGFWVCSKCGFVSEAIAAPKLYNYCPNCGKKMDGGADNG